MSGRRFDFDRWQRAAASYSRRATLRGRSRRSAAPIRRSPSRPRTLSPTRSAAAHRARRTSARLQDRLHQPRHLGALRRVRTDLGAGLGHDGRAQSTAARHRCRWRSSARRASSPRSCSASPARRRRDRDCRAVRLHRMGRAWLRDRRHALRGLAFRRRRHGRRLRAARAPVRRAARAGRALRSRARRAELAATRVVLSCDGRDVEEGAPTSSSTARCTRCACGSTRWRRSRSAGRSSPATSSRPGRSPTLRRCTRANAGRRG